MQRLMVLSSAYRMSSRDSDAKSAAVDPDNRLLHRMPVVRLEAEAIRDSILAVSGRLNERLEGPSVPVHLDEFMTGRGRPTISGPLDGDGRRSIYLAVRRNFLNPMFLAFDYPATATTAGRRGTSNVPAQALALLNNPFIVQQAEAWAKRLTPTGEDSAQQAPGDQWSTRSTRRPSGGSRRALKRAAARRFLEQQERDHGPARAVGGLLRTLPRADQRERVHLRRVSTNRDSPERGIRSRVSWTRRAWRRSGSRCRGPRGCAAGRPG